ncbi:hypothetical protein V1523DRAFT_436618 [Lipomyces doorenjongii]
MLLSVCPENCVLTAYFDRHSVIVMFGRKRSTDVDNRLPPVLETPEESRAREKDLKTRLLMRVWDSFGKTGEERSFLLKMDLFLLLYIILSYLIKTLDSTNISRGGHE